MSLFKPVNNFYMLWAEGLALTAFHALICPIFGLDKAPVSALGIRLVLELMTFVEKLKNLRNSHTVGARQAVFTLCAGDRRKSLVDFLGFGKQTAVCIAEHANTGTAGRFEILFHLFQCGHA